MTKATVHCPHCNKALLTSLENAGRNAKCPKCQKPFIVRFAKTGSTRDDSESDGGDRWRASKDNSSDTSIPPPPPIRATLVVETRYCPECGAKVEASRNTFERPRQCKECSKIVTFIDQTNGRPSTFKDAIEPREIHFEYAWAFVAFGLSFLVFLVLTKVNSLVSATIASICLYVLPFVFLKYRFYYRSLKNAKQLLKSVRKVQEPMARAIEEMQDKYHEYSEMHDKVLQDKEQEARESSRRASNVFDDVLKWIKRQVAVAERERELRELSGAATKVCDLYIRDCVKWIMRKLTVNNYHARQTELEKVIQRCRKAGYSISVRDEKQYMNDLLEEYRRVVAAKAEKEEQARIKAQMREEKRREQQIEQRMKKEEAERRRIEEALDAALKEAKDEHNSEVEELRKQLEEANAQSERTKSMAEQTKAGHVYVVSNFGSFGEDVFKVGMTRRLDPDDRVKELGDASVPFPFDVHAMISCDDAPTLEKALHHDLRVHRVNKVNFRKEFFRVDIEAIIHCVEKHHGTVNYVADPEALEYYESRQMTEDELDIVGSAFDD